MIHVDAFVHLPGAPAAPPPAANTDLAPGMRVEGVDASGPVVVRIAVDANNLTAEVEDAVRRALAAYYPGGRILCTPASVEPMQHWWHPDL